MNRGAVIYLHSQCIVNCCDVNSFSNSFCSIKMYICSEYKHTLFAFVGKQTNNLPEIALRHQQHLFDSY